MQVKKKNFKILFHLSQNGKDQQKTNNKSSMGRVKKRTFMQTYMNLCGELSK